jgi:hypothetical protein
MWQISRYRTHLISKKKKLFHGVSLFDTNCTMYIVHCLCGYAQQFVLTLIVHYKQKVKQLQIFKSNRCADQRIITQNVTILAKSDPMLFWRRSKVGNLTINNTGSIYTTRKFYFSTSFSESANRHKANNSKIWQLN